MQRPAHRLEASFARDALDCAAVRFRTESQTGWLSLNALSVLVPASPPTGDNRLPYGRNPENEGDSFGREVTLRARQVVIEDGCATVHVRRRAIYGRGGEIFISGPYP